MFSFIVFLLFGTVLFVCMAWCMMCMYAVVSKGYEKGDLGVRTDNSDKVIT